MNFVKLEPRPVLSDSIKLQKSFQQLLGHYIYKYTALSHYRKIFHKSVNYPYKTGKIELSLQIPRNHDVFLL